MCVIEEKPKIFELIKNLLTANKSEKNIFLYGNADFTSDIKKYMFENDVIFFRFASPAGDLSDLYPLIDLLVLGECGHYKNRANAIFPGSVRTILLNIDNPGGLNCPDKNAQVITCGLKEKDTVIFSSINLDEGNVILDLQRSIKNIRGETLDPFEKQLSIPDFAMAAKAEDLLLSLTALTLCGRM